MIMTPRNELAMCTQHEDAASVIARNIERYDYLPVTAQGRMGNDDIIGLFHAASFEPGSSPTGYIREHVQGLSEAFLIGADASILEFIETAVNQPCRLVVKGSEIYGLVALSDLHRLPARAALFALITGLEITMVEAIKSLYPETHSWVRLLAPKRRQDLEERIKVAKKNDTIAEDILYTQFCDKRTLIVKGIG